MNQTLQKFIVLTISIGLLTTAIVFTMRDEWMIAFLFYLGTFIMLPFYLELFGPESRKKKKEVENNGSN